MTEPKHTPGPWHFVKADADYRAPNPDDFAIVAANMLCPAIVWAFREEEATANARLIAAAPDLYEALEALVETAVAEVNEKGGAGGAHLARLTDARAALSKARGES